MTRPRVFGEWPASGVTFDIVRGSFEIPAALFDEGREADLARHYAQRMPPEAKPGRREKLGARGVRIHWRITRVVAVV